MAEDVRLLTYDEIADVFGIARESARQLVIRKRWSRRKGNDGRARIEVPEDALAITGSTSDDTGHEAADPSKGTSNSTGEATSDDTGHDTSDLSAAVAILERHTGRLETELSEVREMLATVTAERDTERARVGQVAVLQAVLDLERAHAAEIRADRDAWRVRAEKSPERPWWWSWRRVG